MSMSRKHYVQIANMIRSNLDVDLYTNFGLHYSCGVSAVARDLAEIFREDNPAFDRSRFYIACGLDNDGYAV